MAIAGTLEIDVILNGKKARVGAQKLMKMMGLIEKKAKSTNKVFSKLKSLASIGFLAKMTFDATKFGRSMTLLADRTGIATQKLIGMRSAFSAMGGKATAINKLIGSISKGLAGLSMGKGEYAAKLASMGISAWGAGGKVKKSDVVMGDIADWTKNQLAMGRSNEEIATFLEDNFGIDYETFKLLSLGRTGMAKAQKEMQAKTGTVDDRQVENLNSFYKSIALLKETFLVLSERLAGDFAPALSFVSELLQGFFKELQEVWDTVIQEYWNLVEGTDAVQIAFDALKKVLSALSYWIGGIVKVMIKMSEMLGKVFAWFADKFSWLFGTTAEEKAEKLDNELATRAMSMEFSSPEERLKWLAERSPFYREKYEKYLERKNIPDSIIEEGDIILDEDDMNAEEAVLPIGDEVMGAASDNSSNIEVYVDNDIIENPDGTTTILTNTEVEGEYNSFRQNSYNTITGG